MLNHYLRNQIQQQGGSISFAQFMQAALYHPEFGYYSTRAFQPGDFITAPEISPLFAQCLARQIQQIFAILPEQNILEFGAGSGKLAKDLLLTLEQQNQLPAHYYIIEVSSLLIEQQKKLLREHCPQLIDRVQWLAALPADFIGVVIANEVLDALPTHCFSIENEASKERRVTWQDDNFVWTAIPPQSEELLEKIMALRQEYLLVNGYASEINLNYANFMQPLAASVKQGIILLIDYGYDRREYYQPARSRGTLMCFYQHHRQENPLIQVGEQDITAHVEFTTVAELAVAADFNVAGYTHQNAFLYACGLSELAEKAAKTMNTIQQYQQSQAIKTLVLPTEMGELIKVMALTKGVEIPLLGFGLLDKRREL